MTDRERIAKELFPLIYPGLNIGAWWIEGNMKPNHCYEIADYILAEIKKARVEVAKGLNENCGFICDRCTRTIDDCYYQNIIKANEVKNDAITIGKHSQAGYYTNA